MRTANAALTGGSLLAVLLAAVTLGPSSTAPVLAQAGTQGTWRTVANQVPINPVHAVLLRTGQVLIVAGSGNVASETNFQAAIWDPASETFLTQAIAWDMFCNGMVTLHDGRVLVNGGNLEYDPFLGEPRNAVFDPMTGLFTDVQRMAHGRWYPTVTTLGDGRVMTFSGLLETGGTNTSVEIYTVGSGWSQEYPAGWTPPLYPRMHLSTDGRVFYAGSTRSSRFFNPSNGTWSGIVATTNYSSSRTYGTSVMLPLTPANGYRPRVMIFGGGNPATATTEIIDLSAATPQWTFGPAMSQPRIQMNATLLPNGKVLATGGSRNDEDALTASLNGDLYNPATNTFSPAGANAFPRLYHSNSLLLPDATVLLMGGNPQRGSYERRLEIYSPAYLFNGDGTPALRPSIAGVTPETVYYNAPFAVQTPDAGSIASVVLVRPGTPTHAFDMDQRLVGLSFTAGSGVLNVTAPPNGNIAPPGYYMLFVLNGAGVPSVARFMRISPTPLANQAPVATITSPVGNVAVNPGGVVSFAGIGTDSDGSIGAYSWTFPGGTPGSSTVAAPGNVGYATLGSYVASFTVTDDKGLVSQPATRTITVSTNPTQAPTLVQHTGKDAGTTTSSTLAFTSANTAGNFIAVVIRAGNSGQTFTVTDTRANVYRKAIQLNETVDNTSLAIYYAENIAAGANTVTVADSLANGTLRFAIMEYSGVATANALDVTAGAQGTSTAPSSGPAVTTAHGDLILGAISTANGRTYTAGAGFVIQDFVPATPNTKLVSEDQRQAAAGSIAATATLNVTDTWGAIVAAFRAASGGPPSAPNISGLNPSTAAIGAPVTISGTNFGATQGASTVTFNGTAGSPTSWSATSIVVPVPAGATSGNVVVTVGGIASNGLPFTVPAPAPTLTLLNPTSGVVAMSVTMTGTNFGATQGTSVVRFNGTAATPTSWSATSISAPVPAGATSGNVVVTVGGTASNGLPFTVTQPAPSISSLNPTSGVIGTSVTITGANFGATQSTGTVTFNGTPTTPTSWSATSLVAPVPIGASTGPVVVTVNGLASNPAGFTVTPAASGITLVQHLGKDAGTTQSTTLAFASSNTAGNFIVVAVRAGQVNQVFTVTDTRGNVYRRAIQLNETVDRTSVAIFYAENIGSGPNTVTVSDTLANGTLRMAIMEYSGVAQANSLDVAGSAQGTSTTPNSGQVTTTSNGDLIIGVLTSANPQTVTAGAGFTIQDRVPASPNSKLITEDARQSVAGPIAASGTFSSGDQWGALVVAFKAAAPTP